MVSSAEDMASSTEDMASSAEETSLPKIIVNTEGNEIVDEPKVGATITVEGEGVDPYQGRIAIEWRGSSSLRFPKKNFGFETRDEEDEDLDVSLLGMPEEEDWILHGPYSDKSLMRNVLMYEIAREMGHYASRTKFVELQVNDEPQGVYVFMEKIKRDKKRLAINKLKDDENEGEDLTGGYILKIDKNYKEGHTKENSFNSRLSALSKGTNQVKFQYHEPASDEITPEQRAYISGYIHDFEAALASEDFADPEKGYAAYIDPDSFVDYFLLTEFSGNVDGYRISTYMHKDKGERLKMGPMWDYNLAFGNANYFQAHKTDIWTYRFSERYPADVYPVAFWWGKLLEDPAYVAKVKARWKELRQGVLSDDALASRIDGHAQTLVNSGAMERNFDVWDVLGERLWPNFFVGSTYTQEINFIKEWVVKRTTWLDQAISEL